MKTTSTNYHGKKRNRKNLSKLPPDIVVQIYALASNPEYQHGTGCECADNNAWKNRCPKGQPNYYKISKELKIDPTTTHYYLDDDYKEGFEKKQRKRQGSEKYKEYQKGYKKTEKGQKTTKRAVKKYCDSKNGDKKRKDYWEDYSQSPKGKETQAKWIFIKRSSLTPAQVNLNYLSTAPNSYKNLFNSMFGEDIFAE